VNTNSIINKLFLIILNFLFIACNYKSQINNKKLETGVYKSKKISDFELAMKQLFFNEYYSIGLELKIDSNYFVFKSCSSTLYGKYSIKNDTLFLLFNKAVTKSDTFYFNFNSPSEYFIIVDSKTLMRKRFHKIKNKNAKLIDILEKDISTYENK
jgi:hypothetical protein